MSVHHSPPPLHVHKYPYSVTIDIILPVLGLENMYWVWDPYALRCCGPILRKTFVYYCGLQRKYILFMNGYVGNATFYPRSRHTMSYNMPSGSHWSEQEDIYERRERYASKGINLTTEKRFCAITGISKMLELFYQTVHYFTVGHYLQSRSHQRSLFLLQGEVRTPRKVSHSKLPPETSLNVPQKQNN